MPTTVDRHINILLIEDKPVDARMTQEGFREYPVANTLYVVTDGEAVMDFYLATR